MRTPAPSAFELTQFASLLTLTHRRGGTCAACRTHTSTIALNSFKGNVRRQARASGMGRARDAVVIVGIAHIVRRVLCAQERRRLVGTLLDRVERAPA
jgi:hypothetical protein